MINTYNIHILCAFVGVGVGTLLNASFDAVGNGVGSGVGCDGVGKCVGWFVGDGVGLFDGDGVGLSVGDYTHFTIYNNNW